jgi:hypothetical protein
MSRDTIIIGKVYICIYIYIHMNTYIYMYAYVCIHQWTPPPMSRDIIIIGKAYICICIHVCLYEWICICVNTYIYEHVYIYICIYIYIYIYVYIYVYIYIYTGEGLKIYSKDSTSGKSQLKGYKPPLKIADMLLSSQLKEFYLSAEDVDINKKLMVNASIIFEYVYRCIYILVYKCI